MLAHLCHQVYQKWKVDTPVGSVLAEFMYPICGELGELLSSQCFASCYTCDIL